MVLAFHLFVSRTSTGDGCLFLLEPRASDVKPTKIKKKRQVVKVTRREVPDAARSFMK